ncbi:hypothetical protein COT98_01235 [Candidatus Falkowbacteria bacterium CG10_big_fil_rev_8_21_14_0_10_39_9]|uniref:Uncharacterized protein n=1 Tax=Candidatus Falkowbacteria bacterium CG10_big_fil_rev_8_21_14_0_10_39_9 TaxID=1974566 RepID=A0A2M6WQJ7_9BACT|nr:MAG: hypothetical protein COT98_01235 [Candidatus Falkowbacteria bacterium CG10_big_fil_rev_8_21_14_0_10_39_9]
MLKNMKMKNLTRGLIALSVISMLGAGVLAASAATNTDTTKLGQGRGREMNRPAALTEAQKAEMDTKMATVKAAIAAGDYNTWVTAKKAINENCPELTKITTGNFSKYIEATNLRNQADSIMKDLGIDRPEMKGRGMGEHRGSGQQK